MSIGLASRVCAVRGSALAALYDLSRSRIQRIDVELLESIESGSVRNEHASAIRELSARGFLDTAQGSGSNYFADRAFPDLPAFRMLSIDVLAFDHSSARVELIFDLVRECSTRGLRDVLLVTRGTVNEPTVRFVTRVENELQDINFSVGVKEGVALDSISPAQRTKRRFVRSSIDPIRPDHFRIDWTYFTLLRNRSESDGCIHIDGDLRVSPDIAERDVVIDLCSLLDDLVLPSGRAAVFEGYWSAGKSIREKCQACEFRYACPNGKWGRSSRSNLNSQPANCAYDPESGAWR